jgi:murein L,D-transpeptidase YcbB/YkuD
MQGEKTLPRKNAVFDGVLTERVKRFQLAAGLKPDGVVGPKTMVLLSSEARNGTPALMEKKKDY